MEVWKDIKGFEGLYQVSNLANVRSLDRNVELISKNQFIDFKANRFKKGKILNKVINKKGYYQVVLYKDGKKINKLVHRLFAETFIPNPDNKETINHIDGNTLNNSIDNLEWATMQEQQIHRNYILGHKSIITDKCRKKQIENHQRKVRRSDGVIFESIKIASNGDENLRRHISQVCKNQRKTAGGYRWEYVL